MISLELPIIGSKKDLSIANVLLSKNKVFSI